MRSTSNTEGCILDSPTSAQRYLLVEHKYCNSSTKAAVIAIFSKHQAPLKHRAPSRYFLNHARPGPAYFNPMQQTLKLTTNQWSLKPFQKSQKSPKSPISNTDSPAKPPASRPKSQRTGEKKEGTSPHRFPSKRPLKSMLRSARLPTFAP